jgi:N-acetylglucosamine kinase-like BadF-type ATPase
MKLIADAGSTKIDWCIIAPDGSLKQYASEGVNALMMSQDEMAGAFPAAPAAVDEIHYYGAGCISAEVAAKVERALRCAVGCAASAAVEVASDMLGAARATAGTRQAIVAILGTGSNTCLYDGRAIVDNVPPMGYIIGDYGSGAAMGKELLAAAYKGLLPTRIRTELEQWLQMDYAAIVSRVYTQSAANRFLASLVPFVAERREALHGLIVQCLRRLFEADLSRYPASVELHCVGGVAAAFADELRQVAAEASRPVASIVHHPMKGLINYHSL